MPVRSGDSSGSVVLQFQLVSGTPTPSLVLPSVHTDTASSGRKPRAVCATCCYIFVNPFTSCVTDRYLSQQYITMQTNKRIAY